MKMYGQGRSSNLALEAAGRSILERITRPSGGFELYDWSSRRENRATAFLRRNKGIRAWLLWGSPLQMPCFTLLIDNFLCASFFIEKGVMIVSVDRETLRVLRDRCIGRRDSYALQQADGRYLRQRESLSWELLQLHLVGSLTLGTYLIDARGFCRFAVFDADGRSGGDDLVALVQVRERLAGLGIASALELSRRGGHLWVFLARPSLPALVRRWLLPFCPAGVEFYPKQDRATWSEPGSLIRVPLGVHRRSERRYPFLQVVAGQLLPAARSVSASLAWLDQVERVAVPDLPALPALDQESPSTRTYVAKNASGRSQAVFTTIHAWCASQDSLAVIGRYVTLDGRGMGCCPFGWHHRMGEDRHPSLWVHEPRGPGAPCWYCHTWGRGGNLFDFLCMYTGLDARSLWARIRSGDEF